MEPIRTFASRMVALPVDDVDTDQIIPARFLKVTDREGLGAALFADWRYDTEGQPRPDFPLNWRGAAGARVLVAGRNFGCGSSREHAPWALVGFGFRAVVSTSFADIFRNNAIANGLLPIELGLNAHGRLMRIAAEDPTAELVVSLEKQTVTYPDGFVSVFPIDAFDRRCLLNGVDRLGFLLGQEEGIAAFEQRHMAGPFTIVGPGCA